MTHTKGPWLLGTGSGGGAPTYVYEDDGTGQQCSAIAACYLEGVHRSYDERTANAARIVACVNACEALDNSALDAGAIAKMVEFITDLRASLEADGFHGDAPDECHEECVSILALINGQTA